MHTSAHKILAPTHVAFSKPLKRQQQPPSKISLDVCFLGKGVGGGGGAQHWGGLRGECVISNLSFKAITQTRICVLWELMKANVRLAKFFSPLSTECLIEGFGVCYMCSKALGTRLYWLKCTFRTVCVSFSALISADWCASLSESLSSYPHPARREPGREGREGGREGGRNGVRGRKTG